MPRSAPRKTNRPAGAPPRRRPVAGARARRPVGATGAAGAVDAESTVSLDKSPASPASRRPSPRPAPSPARPKAAARRQIQLPASRLLPGLVAATVVLAVLVSILGWFSWQQARTDEARREALAAARPHAQRILSYDYRHLDSDIAAAKRATTGSFRDEYAKTSSTVVKPTALQVKAVVSAQVKAASVRSASPDKVVVLLFVNQTVTNTKITGSKVDQSRVRMTLVKRGDEWLVSGIDAL